MSGSESDETLGSLATLLGALAAIAEVPPVLAPGRRVGRYVVLDTLGAGGMGVVYSAYDPQLDRRVALKLVRRGHATPEPGSEPPDSRTLREARALAKLVHPNVVTLYEADLHEGSMYLAMELVEGAAMSSWMTEQPRSWPEIVSVFLQAGAGLAAAHRAGIVHRDVKPHNILIGADGRVRVADFGVARLDTGAQGYVGIITGGDDTQTGAIVGTPAYMAPEQLAGARIDARTDQYGFCAALHEALYGVRHSSTAPRPERKVPRWLRRVIARGLAKDPEARFATMDDLLAAMERGRHTTRRRVLWASAVVGVGAFAALAQPALFAADTCGGADAAMLPYWNPELREAARRAFTRASPTMGLRVWTDVERALDAYSRDWIAMHGDSCRAARSGAQSAMMLDRRMACLQRGAAQVGMLAKVFRTADMNVVGAAPMAVEQLPQLDRCADLTALDRETPPPSDPEKAARLTSVRGEVAAAAAYFSTNRMQDGLAAASQALAKARAEDYAPLIAEAASRLGEIQAAVGDPAAAEHSFSEAAERAIAGGAEEWTIFALGGLAEAAGWQERPADAQRWLRLARAALERKGDDAALSARMHRVNATVLWTAGRFAEAIPEAQAAIADFQRLGGADSAAALYAENRLGLLYVSAGANREAERTLTAVVARLDARYGDHPAAFASLRMLALIARVRHDGKRAVALATRALDIAERLVPRQVAAAHLELGEALLADDRLDDAVRELERAREAPAMAAQAVLGLARIARRRGKADDAMRLAREALASSKSPDEQVELGNFVGALERERGDLEASLALLERGLAAIDARQGRNHPASARAIVELAMTLVARGRLDRARDLLVPLVAVAGADPDFDPADVADAQLTLAKALGPEARAQARALAESAKSGFGRLGGGYADQQRAAVAWLEKHPL